MQVVRHSTARRTTIVISSAQSFVRRKIKAPGVSRKEVMPRSADAKGGDLRAVVLHGAKATGMINPQALYCVLCITGASLIYGTKQENKELEKQ